MTRKLLKEIENDYWHEEADPVDMAEVFDLAKWALEQPCDDCINRADILDAIETWDKFGINAEQKLIRWQDHYVPYVHLDDVRNAIANMPSVTPQQTRWIPVSKELPEENIHVLCQFYMGGMAECYHAHGVWHIVGGYRISCDEVVAWMPLPQPYKKESEWGSIGNNTDLETVPTNLQDWLSTFNTESATECFTAVQQLKERVNE